MVRIIWLKNRWKSFKRSLTYFCSDGVSFPRLSDLGPSRSSVCLAALSPVEWAPSSVSAAVYTVLRTGSGGAKRRWETVTVVSSRLISLSFSLANSLPRFEGFPEMRSMYTASRKLYTVSEVWGLPFMMSTLEGGRGFPESRRSKGGQ